MQLNQLQRKNPNQGSKRIGRGRASGKGKTAGRGTKGQKARAGHKIWPNVREQLKKIPKLRGRGVHGLRSIQEKPTVINVSTLEAHFSAGDTITKEVLRERNIVRGKSPIKVLGEGELTKKFTLAGLPVSKSAKEKIEKVGGVIT